MKLMDIDADTLGIPDTEYDARVTMLAGEFTRIVRDLSSLGESVRIEVSKEGVRFASDGEAAQGNILLKQTDAARERYENYGKDDEEDDVKEDSDEEEKPTKAKKKEKEKVKAKQKVKKEEGADDEDEEMANADEDEAEFKAKSEDEDEDEDKDDGEEEVSDSEKKKRKRAAASSSVRPSPFCKISVDEGPQKSKKKVKKTVESSDGGGGVHIEMTQHVNLTFSLKYLVNFSKSSSLSDTVQLMLKNDVPLLVSTLNNLARSTYDPFSGILYVRSRIHSVLSRTQDRGRMSTVLRC